MRCRVDVAFLKRLRQQSARKRAALIRLATPKEVNSVSEVCMNLVKGRLPIRPAILRRLKKHKTSIRKIGSKKLSIKKKKALLVQRGGGFLLPLLGAALPFLTNLIQGRRE